LSYKALLPLSLGDLVGMFALDSLREFILFISGSDASSATPRTVALMHQLVNKKP
jgi:hypothetical protein